MNALGNVYENQETEPKRNTNYEQSYIILFVAGEGGLWEFHFHPYL